MREVFTGHFFARVSGQSSARQFYSRQFFLKQSFMTQSFMKQFLMRQFLFIAIILFMVAMPVNSMVVSAEEPLVDDTVTVNISGPEDVDFKLVQNGYDVYVTWKRVTSAAKYTLTSKFNEAVAEVDDPGNGETVEYCLDLLTANAATTKNSKTNTYTVSIEMSAQDASGNCIKFEYPKGNSVMNFSAEGTFGTGVSLDGRVTVAAANAYYNNGDPVTTTFTCTDILSVEKGGLLVTDDMYTVEYSNNTAVGLASATLTAKRGSRLYGSRTVSFNIMPISYMIFDTTKEAFVISSEAALHTFADIVSGIATKDAEYRVRDTNNQDYAGSIAYSADSNIDVKAILNQDLVLTNCIEFVGKSGKMAGCIDLNGHMITTSASDLIKLSNVDLDIVSSSSTPGTLKKTGGDAYLLYENGTSDLSISNLILDAGTSGARTSHAIGAHNGTLTMSSCKIYNPYSEGIYLDGASNLSISDCDFDTYNACVFNYSAVISIADSTLSSRSNRAVFSDPNTGVIKPLTITDSDLTGFSGVLNSATTACSEIMPALWLYSKCPLTITDCNVVGFNAGICTYGSVIMDGTTVEAQRGILTQDVPDGYDPSSYTAVPSQRYKEYSVGLLFIGDATATVSLKDSVLKANTL